MARLKLTKSSLPGDALRYIRKVRVLTIFNVCETTETDPGYFSRIETSQRKPFTQKKKVKSIANALDVDENLLRRVLLCDLNPIGKDLADEVKKAMDLKTTPKDVLVAVRGQKVTITINKVVISIAAPPGTKIAVKQ